MQRLACHRFRRIAALSVDGEPDELEALALARHLERCPSCHSFAATVDRFTRDIRSAKLESYRVEWVAPPRRRNTEGMIRRSLTGLAAAAVVVFAASAGAVFESYKSQTEVPRSLPALVIDASGADTARETQRFLRGLRDASLARTVGAPLPGIPDRPGVKAG
jgi:putative zinc finger protein